MNPFTARHTTESIFDDLVRVVIDCGGYDADPEISYGVRHKVAGSTFRVARLTLSNGMHLVAGELANQLPLDPNQKKTARTPLTGSGSVV